jgi:hypothetical protein
MTRLFNAARHKSNHVIEVFFWKYCSANDAPYAMTRVKGPCVAVSVNYA